MELLEQGRNYDEIIKGLKMPTADRQLIYTDVQTGRVARIRDYDSLVTPAELEEFSWQLIMTNKIPREAFENTTDWEISQRGWFFTKAPTELTAEHKTRIELSSKRASCMEQASKIVNFMRFRRTKHVYAHPQVVTLYNKEIDLYKSTQAVGPLLMSLVDDINDLPVALAEFEITNSQYNDFLISSEIMRNKWNRQIKNASDPESVLASIKQSIGM